MTQGPAHAIAAGISIIIEGTRMLIRNAITIREIEGISPGELIYFELEGASALGILIKRVEHEPLVIGVLHSNASPEASPFLLTYASDVPCVSLGSNWVIEAMPDENTWPGNSSLDERGGALHIINDGVALRFGRDATNPQSRGMTVHLKTMQATKLRAYAYAPTLNWKIWATDASPRHSGEKPIIEFRG